MTKSLTLFEKVWNKHVVKQIENGPSVLYIDKHLIHEVTSPQAFQGLKQRGIKVFRPQQIVATADHNVPTINQHLPIKEELSRIQVETLLKNCAEHNISCYGLGNEHQGIVHVIGPELGITQPGMTIVCGDSHTSTHGAFGAIAFGIGTSEVEMVFATQCLLQTKPKLMRINIDGELPHGVVSKDVVLYILATISASGATGYAIEFAGTAIRNMSMEARMTICNMSIEMGARCGMIAPDEITFDYLKNKKFAPQGEEWNKKLNYWKTLHSDSDAKFDKEIFIDATKIKPMITYGVNPGMGIGIDENIPSLDEIKIEDKANLTKSLLYMGFGQGEKMLGKKIDYVFIGSCTNSRIEDLRLAAKIIKGKKKAEGVTVWIVPGSKLVEKQAIEEGLAKIFEDADMPMRQSGCSACLAMNEDKVPEGKYCVSTSNRNFEGRQGQLSRTLLASPLTAAVAAITGEIADVRNFLN